MVLCVYEEGQGQEYVSHPLYLCGVEWVHGAVQSSAEREGRGGGPAEGEGSEGMKGTVINYCVPT